MWCNSVWLWLFFSTSACLLSPSLTSVCALLATLFDTRVLISSLVWRQSVYVSSFVSTSLWNCCCLLTGLFMCLPFKCTVTLHLVEDQRRHTVSPHSLLHFQKMDIWAWFWVKILLYFKSTQATPPFPPMLAAYQKWRGAFSGSWLTIMTVVFELHHPPPVGLLFTVSVFIWFLWAEIILNRVSMVGEFFWKCSRWNYNVKDSLFL